MGPDTGRASRLHGAATLELVLGGARSGKSDWAVARAREIGGTVLFVATAEPLDADMAARIASHRHARPGGWDTLEEPRAVATRLRSLTNAYDVVILDCLTLLVSNWMLAAADLAATDLAANDLAAADRKKKTPRVVGSVTMPTRDGDESSFEHRLVEVCAALRARGRHAVVVSNEVGSGIVPEVPLARRFRDRLGAANRVVAREADTVRLLVAGLPLSLKGL